MQKQIITKIAIFAIIGLLLTTAVTFYLQTSLAKSNADVTAQTLLNQIAEKLEENEEDIAALKASLNEEYLTKARSFSHMIKLNPDILNDLDELMRIQEILGVDELHVTDDKGILLWGTVASYIQFDFSLADQTRPFMRILEEPEYELAQEPTPNGAIQKLFQYIGVSREDATGIVQIGMEPSRLDEALKNNSIQNVLKDYKIGTQGFVLAANPDDNTITAFPNEANIGKQLSEIGIYNATKGFANVDGTEYYYNADEIDGNIIYTMLPQSELYAQRSYNVALTFALFTIIFLLMVVMIAWIIRKDIIIGLKKVVATVEDISGGNMEANVDVRSSKEFISLSDGINTMVGHIKKKVNETESLIEHQNELLADIMNTASTINAYSENMADVSRTVSRGASTQASIVSQLSTFFNSILEQVRENTESTQTASKIAGESEQQLEVGMDKINQMNTAMEDINEASMNISQVIKTVSDIAFQTNILALNASVEAARAGEQGKGFAVVATEVRNLANKTTEAANDTTELIERALRTVEAGQTIAAETSEAMKGILDGTKMSTKLIGEISTATSAQADAIADMTKGVNQISDVIQENVRVSAEAEQTAARLSQQAEVLNGMVKK